MCTTFHLRYLHVYAPLYMIKSKMKYFKGTYQTSFYTPTIMQISLQYRAVQWQLTQIHLPLWCISPHLVQTPMRLYLHFLQPTHHLIQQLLPSQPPPPPPPAAITIIIPHPPPPSYLTHHQDKNYSNHYKLITYATYIFILCTIQHHDNYTHTNTYEIIV